MRKRLRGLLLASGVLTVVAALTIVFTPRERLLLSQAQKLPLSISAFFAGPDYMGADAWRSEGEQLILHDVPGTAHSAVYVRDLRSTRETPLDAFNQRFAAQLTLTATVLPGGWRRTYTRATCAFSPDGKWLLWQTGQTWRAFALDGSGQRAWPRDPKANRYRKPVYWCANNRQWLEPRYDNTFHVNGCVLHSLEPGVADVERTFANSAGHWVVGVTRDNHLLTEEVFTGSLGTHALYDTPLDADRTPNRALAVNLPFHSVLTWAHLSPDGARLLWTLETRRDLPGPPWLQSVLRWLGRKPQQQNGVWVSLPDGSGLREIGHIPIVALPGGHVNRFYDARWPGDNTHALLFYGDALYTVAVP